MYYKVENKDCGLYKTLLQMRKQELQNEADNIKEISEKYGEWQMCFAYPSQKYYRNRMFTGFLFKDTEKLDLKAWVKDKEFPTYWLPNKRSKSGKEVIKVLESLKFTRFYTLLDALELKPIVGTPFSYPYMEISQQNETIILYLDEKWEPKDENIIEITKKEFQKFTI